MCLRGYDNDGPSRSFTSRIPADLCTFLHANPYQTHTHQWCRNELVCCVPQNFYLPVECTKVDFLGTRICALYNNGFSLVKFKVIFEILCDETVANLCGLLAGHGPNSRKKTADLCWKIVPYRFHFRAESPVGAFRLTVRQPSYEAFLLFLLTDRRVEREHLRYIWMSFRFTLMQVTLLLPTVAPSMKLWQIPLLNRVWNFLGALQPTYIPTRLCTTF